MSLLDLWSLKDTRDVFPDLLPDFRDGTAAVDDFDALRVMPGEVEIALPDALVKLQRLAFHPVKEFPATGAFEADARIEINDQRQIRYAIADGKSIDESDALGRYLSTNALVNRRGIEKPVGDHHGALGEGWLDDFADELGAAGAKEKQLGLGDHPGRLFAVLEDVTNLFAHICPTGFAHDQNGVAGLSQSRNGALNVGRFAAAFAPFKADEFAGNGHYMGNRCG